MVLFGFLIPLGLITLFYVLIKRQIRAINRNLCRQLNESLALTRYSSFRYQSKFKTPRDSIQLNRDSEMSNFFSFFLINKSNPQISKTTRHTKSNLSTIIRRENRVLKTIVMNVACFLIAWLPYTIVVLLAQYSDYTMAYITPYTASSPAIFSKISSFYNPILYTLSNKECLRYYLNKFSK